MDPSSGFLHTVATVAVAFAGFSGVVIALSHLHLHPRVRYFRIRGMVGMALFTVLAAVFPLLLSTFGLPVDVTWRLAAAILAPACTLLVVWVNRQYLALRRDGLMRSRKSFVGHNALSTAGILGLGLGAVGPWPVLASAMYLIMAFFGLYWCCFQFAVLISSTDDGKAVS